MSGCETEPRDRGQVAPLMAMVVLLVVAVGAGVVAVGDVLAERAVARTAADAAALAAAAGTDADAESLAADNGAVVVAIHRHGPDVEVEVRVGRATARARATSARDNPPHAAARPHSDVIP
jgi:Flp pilus assembly protein TadG